MGTRIRQEKERKTQKGARGEGKNMFFGNDIKDTERASNRCESLIIVFFFFSYF